MIILVSSIYPRYLYINHYVICRQNSSDIICKVRYGQIYKRSEHLPKEIIKNPEIWIYVDRFGCRKGDYCLIAEVGTKTVGAVWVRILSEKPRGYGNMDNETPEFAISLYPEYRNKGIGTELMSRMIGYLRAVGYSKASLSVNKNNYALRMYLKLGFAIVEERERA